MAKYRDNEDENLTPDEKYYRDLLGLNPSYGESFDQSYIDSVNKIDNRKIAENRLKQLKKEFYSKIKDIGLAIFGLALIYGSVSNINYRDSHSEKKYSSLNKSIVECLVSEKIEERSFSNINKELEMIILNNPISDNLPKLKDIEQKLGIASKSSDSIYQRTILVDSMDQIKKIKEKEGNPSLLSSLMMTVGFGILGYCSYVAVSDLLTFKKKYRKVHED
ncbi:MAG: hypothetical protein Q7S27_05385 [Nanoarchaeota archaeon]|nr:hypothetical protein [Nanoarchaeota archaeon]